MTPGRFQPLVNIAPGTSIQPNGGLTVELDGIAVTGNFTLQEGYHEVVVQATVPPPPPVPPPVAYRFAVFSSDSLIANTRRVEQDDSPLSLPRLRDRLPVSYNRKAVAVGAPSWLVVQVDRAAMVLIEALDAAGVWTHVANCEALRPGFWNSGRFILSRGLSRFRLSAPMTSGPIVIDLDAPDLGAFEAGQSPEIPDLVPPPA